MAESAEKYLESLETFQDQLNKSTIWVTVKRSRFLKGMLILLLTLICGIIFFTLTWIFNASDNYSEKMIIMLSSCTAIIGSTVALIIPFLMRELEKTQEPQLELDVNESNYDGNQYLIITTTLNNLGRDRLLLDGASIIIEKAQDLKYSQARKYIFDPFQAKEMFR